MNSLRNWLRQEILQVLNRKSSQPPFLVWCDPQCVWKELLQAASENTFELWAEDTHELMLRSKFYNTPRQHRVIWLPVSKENITYFQVFALQAETVKEITLPEALAQYGLDIPSATLAELKPILAAHAKEWLDYPQSHWQELTPGNAKGTLVNDERVLELLATPGLTFASLIADNRFPIFKRRIVEDFGLPSPEPDNPEKWRIQAVASLLLTEAATNCPHYPPVDEKIITNGVAKNLSLNLLNRWQKQIDLINYFEELAVKADKQTNLQTWAQNLTFIPLPLASPAAETALFQKEVSRLSAIDSFELLAKHLQDNLDIYQNHAAAFWGKQAKLFVPWEQLVKLGQIANLLYQQRQVEKTWQTLPDAVKWFTTCGWLVDQAGEALFQEDHQLPQELAGVRYQLRKAYQEHLDDINVSFCDLLSHSSLASLNLPFAGEAIADIVNKATTKEPVAVLILDACRYDLGCRLAELINQGEPTTRAHISPAQAPIPSITALGMPFCLPGISDQLKVEFSEKSSSSWQVTVTDFTGNLSSAEQRREWLKKNYKLKDKSLLTVEEVLNTDTPESINSKNLGKLVFIFGDDFDDHDGVLQPFGLNPTVERYANLIRRLRSGGYNSICMVTDHGFFHWDPDADEKDLAKPDGTTLWKSRRAIAGESLQHPSALKLSVTASNLDCYVPRSVNAFKTYGRLGFFHGGATLQELIIPVFIAHWPNKTRKIDVVLKPVVHITSLNQRVEVEPAGGQLSLSGSLDETLTSRQVLVKVFHPSTGKLLFRSKTPVMLEPGGTSQTLELIKVEGANAQIDEKLDIRVIDADDEDILDSSKVTLKVELDEWF
jgi:hypothetical protein